MPVRLNRYLASAGLGSRRAVDELIRAGRVTVNGEVRELGAAVGDGDLVAVDGRPVAPQELAYLMLHKPSGVVTTASDPQRRRTVLDLVQSQQRVYPVGRLDRDTTGLLLLTNDGELANRLAHPRHGVDKTYVADVEGDPVSRGAPPAGGRGGAGRRADGAGPRSAPGAGRLELVIHEGRNRQVRRMCEAVGHPVRRLHRTAYGPLELGTLAPGLWRPLTAEEVAALRSA